MRISDWSSDVCSSDLLAVLDAPGVGSDRRGVALRDRPGAVAAVLRCVARRIGGEDVAVGGRGETTDGVLMAVSEFVIGLDGPAVVDRRTEVRPVGEAGGNSGWVRRSPEQQKKRKEN